MSKWAEKWDSPLRWSVKSQSSGAIYIVDLSLWQCQCTRSRCGPRGITKPHDELFREGWSRLNHDIQCFHKLTALRAFYAEYVEPRIADMPILREFLTPELSGHQDALALAFVNHLHATEEAEAAKSDTGVAPEASERNRAYQAETDWIEGGWK